MSHQDRERYEYDRPRRAGFDREAEQESASMLRRERNRNKEYEKGYEREYTQVRADRDSRWARESVYETDRDDRSSRRGRYEEVPYASSRLAPSIVGSHYPLLDREDASSEVSSATPSLASSRIADIASLYRADASSSSQRRGGSPHPNLPRTHLSDASTELRPKHSVGGQSIIPSRRPGEEPSVHSRRPLLVEEPRSPVTSKPVSLSEVRSQSEAPSRASSLAASTAVQKTSPAPEGTHLSEGFERLKLTSFLVRPGYGNKGKAIDVASNFYQVRAQGPRAKIIFHYDVEINPHVRTVNQKKPVGLLRAVWEQLIIDQVDNGWEIPFSVSAFDGRKNAFTPVPFPISDGKLQTFTVALAAEGVQSKEKRESSSSDSEQRRWKIAIKLVAMVDLESVMTYCKADQTIPRNEEESLTALMSTNVLLRDVPSKMYTQVGATGNRFFTMDGNKAISQGAIVCRGFMQSFRHSNSGLPLLNLDLGYSAFLAPGPALEVIGKILTRAAPKGGPRNAIPPPLHPKDLHELTPQDILILKSKLKGAKFTVTHRPSRRLHTILSVTSHAAEAITFEISEKGDKPTRMISIVEYYKQFHGVVVTKPRLPCIQYGKKTFIPIEFVHLAQFNSLPPMKLSADQTARMISISAQNPGVRFATIQQWRSELAYEKQPKIKAWGLQVNTTPVQVKARILSPPKVMYAHGNDARATLGSWNLRNKQFARPINRPLTAWSVISFDRYCDADDMQRYIVYLCRTLISLGVQVANKEPECLGPFNPTVESNIVEALSKGAKSAYMKGGKMYPQLIVVILPGRDAWLYEAIKRISFTELKGPVPTQCLQAMKIRRDDKGIDAYTSNVAMKIHSKLGGLTHQVPLSDLPGMVKGKTMLLGADLGHPPMKAGYADAPTVACSIATYNADCDAYSAQIRLQEGRGEIIMELSSMVEEHLQIFHKKNASYPERILIFRDGISEGQYAAALQYEHNAVVQACKRLVKGYRPRILICICAKRHNTRFFGQTADCDRTGNLKPGLVVDRSVVHPYAFDFFLQAHAGLVGTARPTHYICLLDELGSSPDQLQQLVNALCYTFARCTRSVSLVPVCYIADLVCQKARIFVHEPGTSTAPSVTSVGRGSEEKPRVSSLDIMQIQKIMARNPELASVAWWM
ncbi:eukaryotic translation initiation factor 2C, partial [Tremellales sp. Uapishka_1]